MQPVVEFGTRRILIVVAVMMAALLQTLDATIVNVALPTIEGNVGASIDDGTWIITGYIITNVIVIPLAPFLLRKIGRRQYYATCIIGFTIASVLCGLSTSLAELVFFRVVQGAFGGGLIATSQIVLRDTFPKERLGTSSALFAIALTLGPALGPTLGGILTDAYSWQWVFDINLVPGIIAATLIILMLKNPTKPEPLPVDVVGLASLAVGFGALQYFLDEGNRNDWFDDGRIVFAACLAVTSLLAFVGWELWGTRAPIVDLRIFRFRNVRAGFPAGILLGAVVFGPTVMLPQYVQGVLGYTATLSGVLILMRALPVMVLTMIVARFAAKMDARFIIGTGLLLSTVSFVGLSLSMTSTSDFGTFTGWLLLSGVGQSMLLVPLLVAVLGSIPPSESPKASVFIALSVQLGGSIASTVLVTIYDRRTFFHSDIYRGAVTLAHPRVAEAIARHGGLAAASRLVAVQASNAGFADAIGVIAVAAVAAIGFVAFFTPRKAVA
jgi:DHA2 family multidrug resistance protein